MQSAPISNVYAAAGDYTAITGIAGKRIVITGLYVSSSASITLTLKSNTTALSGAMYIGAVDRLSFSSAPFTVMDEWWVTKTNPGENFIITASGAATIAGIVQYRYEAV